MVLNYSSQNYYPVSVFIVASVFAGSIRMLPSHGVIKREPIMSTYTAVARSSACLQRNLWHPLALQVYLQ